MCADSDPEAVRASRCRHHRGGRCCGRGEDHGDWEDRWGGQTHNGDRELLEDGGGKTGRFTWYSFKLVGTEQSDMYPEKKTTVPPRQWDPRTKEACCH